MSIEHYHLVVLLKRSSNRQRVLGIIAESKVALDSKELSNVSGITQSNVIRILNELEKEKAIREVARVKRGKMYVITDKGQKALLLLRKSM